MTGPRSPTRGEASYYREGPPAEGPEPALGAGRFFFVGDMRALAAAPPPVVALWHGAAAPPRYGIKTRARA